MAEALTVERYAGEAPDQGVLCLKGPLTTENVFPFQSAIQRERSTTVVLDFTDVPYVDSAGLGSLVKAFITRHKAGHRMALSGVNPRVLRLLEITRTEQLFLIFPTTEVALAALTHPATA
jgi:anti-sigma B factor antagonist